MFKKNLTAVGFEPTPTKVDCDIQCFPERSALDHSSILPFKIINIYLGEIIKKKKLLFAIIKLILLKPA